MSKCVAESFRKIPPEDFNNVSEGITLQFHTRGWAYKDERKKNASIAIQAHHLRAALAAGKNSHTLERSKSNNFAKFENVPLTHSPLAAEVQARSHRV